VKASDGQPTFTHESRDSGRPAMTQPFFYWTLTTRSQRFSGSTAMFLNMHSSTTGSGPGFARKWRRPMRKRALNVAVHHPVYSFDDHHSGSPTMGKELEDAINTSRRGAREKGAFLAGDCRVAALLAMTV
jgi:hypothetical protein